MFGSSTDNLILIQNCKCVHHSFSNLSLDTVLIWNQYNIVLFCMLIVICLKLPIYLSLSLFGQSKQPSLSGTHQIPVLKYEDLKELWKTFDGKTFGFFFPLCCFTVSSLAPFAQMLSAVFIQTIRMPLSLIFLQCVCQLKCLQYPSVSFQPSSKNDFAVGCAIYPSILIFVL